MVQGRKAKAKKRKANGEFANATTLRVKAQDVQDIEVTEEELKEAMEEIRTRQKGVSATCWDLPICSSSISDYEDIESPIFPNTEQYRLRYATYRDLWRKGFFLTDGFKFGCDYLAYQGPPDEVHSRFMVRCFNSHCSIAPQTLIAMSRVSSQVKKTILIAFVSDDSVSPYYMETKWWRVK
ncbi:hypothetical protein L596_014556 [Steinernema carpocapsae]|nr:hypothetical protein L596_014556 [Steinernema carpocapsae]